MVSRWKMVQNLAQNKSLQPVTSQPVTGRVMPHGSIYHASFVVAKTSIGNSSGTSMVMVSVR